MNELRRRTQLEIRLEEAAYAYMVEAGSVNTLLEVPAFVAGAGYERDRIISLLRAAQDQSPEEWADWLADQLSK